MWDQAFGPLFGINIINYYGPCIYEIIGISTQQSLMIIGISGTLSIVCCTICLWLLERAKRVKALIVSAGGCALALVVNAALLQRLEGARLNQFRAIVEMNFVFSLFYVSMGVIS